MISRWRVLSSRLMTGVTGGWTGLIWNDFCGNLSILRRRLNLSQFWGDLIWTATQRLIIRSSRLGSNLGWPPTEANVTKLDSKPQRRRGQNPMMAACNGHQAKKYFKSKNHLRSSSHRRMHQKSDLPHPMWPIREGEKLSFLMLIQKQDKDQIVITSWAPNQNSISLGRRVGKILMHLIRNIRRRRDPSSTEKKGSRIFTSQGMGVPWESAPPNNNIPARIMTTLATTTTLSYRDLR